MNKKNFNSAQIPETFQVPQEFVDLTCRQMRNLKLLNDHSVEFDEHALRCSYCRQWNDFQQKIMAVSYNADPVAPSAEIDEAISQLAARRLHNITRCQSKHFFSFGKIAAMLVIGLTAGLIAYVTIPGQNEFTIDANSVAANSNDELLLNNFDWTDIEQETDDLKVLITLSGAVWKN